MYRWKRLWKNGPESTLDPGSLKTSTSFQATSCLTLAYIRLSHLDCWIARLPATSWSIEDAAHHLLTANNGRSRRSWNASSLIHSVHSLMMVVRIGMEYARRILAFHWDPQHFLCWTESVIHLSKWLAVASATVTTSPLNREHSDTAINLVRYVSLTPNRQRNSYIDLALSNPRGSSTLGLV